MKKVEEKKEIRFCKKCKIGKVKDYFMISFCDNCGKEEK